MPDVHTQTLMTGKRIETVTQEIRKLRQAKYTRTYKKKVTKKKNGATKRIVDQVGKHMAEHIVEDTLQRQQKARDYTAEWYARNVQRKRDYNAEYRKRKSLEKHRIVEATKVAARKKARAPAASAFLPAIEDKVDV